VSEQTIRKMLSREQVLVPFSLATLKREIKAGRFPQSHEIAVRRVAWFEDEVVAWQSERTQAA
jgi:prophage regulatory protein